MLATGLEGKTVLVTGASTGIGRAVALALAEQGATVAGNYCSSQDKAESLLEEIEAKGGDAVIVRADVSCAADVDAMFDYILGRFGGRLDILINNAGQWMAKHPIAECPEELWDQMMAVNLKSVFLCSRAAIPVMKEQRGGVIVNTTSIASYTGGGGGTVPYAAAKAGVNALTRGMARELAPYSIRVNGVAPGLVDTPMQEKFSTPEQLESWARQIPLRRIGQPEDLVGALLYLASPLSDYVTGEIIEVNGGLLMH